jgi:secondary thiamine-phosphate synthase enzyme
MLTLTRQTTAHQEMVDITQEVADAVRGWTCAAVLIFTPHTTAGIMVNANADEDVPNDILLALEQIVPEAGPYKHSTGNSPSHVRAALIGASQMVPLEDGRLALGTWQSVYLAEFDGPRTRSVLITPIE